MPLSFRSCLLSSALTLLWTSPAFAAEGSADAADAERVEIVVNGLLQRESSATGLPLTIREMPQSITLIGRDRIEDFGLTNVNDLLTQTVGINVERVETDRTTYNSRGFDITNFQVDGIGLPLIGDLQYGDVDTVLFDRVEVIRGANAIMTGVGNPSATINYIRKRPTREFHASVEGTLGSWNQKRIEADISGPLTRSGNLTARLIAAHEDKDSYLDYNHVNRDVFGALVSWDIAPGLTATAGYSYQKNKARGVLWGALPLSYTNGERIDYPVSASTGADWTYWNTKDQTAFAELAYAFDNGWQVKGVYTYKRFETNARLLYAYAYPDKETGEGVLGMSGLYPSAYNRYLGDFYASGPVHLFGREHQLAFGVSNGVSRALEYEDYSEDTEIPYPAIGRWGQAQPAQPVYPGAYLAAQYRDRLTRAYGSAHIHVTDRLKVIAGATAIWLDSTGFSYGVDQSRKNSGVSPYVGAVYDVTPHISLYGSYTGIYNPQKEVDVTNHKLDPAKGTGLEGGIKSEWLDKRLSVTAALFRARQKGLADGAGFFEAGQGPIGGEYYVGTDVTSRGFEIEWQGRVTPDWTVSGGYTGLEIKDQSGNPARIFLPRKTFKLATTYAMPRYRDLKLGAQLRWQSAIHYLDSGVQDYGVVNGDVYLTQKNYAVLDLMASIRLVDHLRASVNVRNVTDTQYLGSLQWGQAFYAAPRSVMASLRFEY